MGGYLSSETSEVPVTPVPSHEPTRFAPFDASPVFRFSGPVITPPSTSIPRQSASPARTLDQVGDNVATPSSTTGSIPRQSASPARTLDQVGDNVATPSSTSIPRQPASSTPVSASARPSGASQGRDAARSDSALPASADNGLTAASVASNEPVVRAGGASVDSLAAGDKGVEKISLGDLQRGAGYVDFLSDVGSGECALLDGESLLFAAMNDDLVDRTFGGQLLHVAWNMERIIADLRKRGITLHIVFFNGYTSYWQDMPAIATCRLAMIRHLRETNTCPVHVMPGWAHGDRWDRFLAAVRPAYIILQRFWSLAIPSLRKQLSVRLAHQCHMSLLDIVELDGMREVGSALRAHHFPVPLPMRRTPLKPLPVEKPTAFDEPPVSLNDQRLAALPTLRTKLHVCALAHAATIEHAIAVWTVYLALHDHLPLHDRAVNLPAGQESIAAIAETTDKVCRWIRKYMVTVGSTFPYDPSLVDLFDGRLLYFAAVHVEELSRCDDLAVTIAAIQDTLIALGGIDLRDKPITRPPEWKFAPMDDEEDVIDEVTPVLPVSNEEMQQIVRVDVLERLGDWEEAKQQAPAKTGQASGNKGRNRRGGFTDHHYHSARPLQPATGAHFLWHSRRLFNLNVTGNRVFYTPPPMPPAAANCITIDAIRTSEQLRVRQQAAKERLKTSTSTPTAFFAPILSKEEGDATMDLLEAALDFKDKQRVFVGLRTIILQYLHMRHPPGKRLARLASKAALLLKLPDVINIVNMMIEDRYDDTRALHERRASGPPSVAVAFQLQQLGSKLLRPVGEADPRVNFKPDAWQRRLLDAIDAEASVLAVAPTSAGKTFVAYYAIESTLRRDDTSIVVYVAPTRALVKQTFDDVRARFFKAYPNERQQMVGMFTRDDRISIDTCQVLVTVPQCLMILLLRPDGDAWARRVRYIIHDEVHLIGSEQGDVIEQLILLADVPVVALSATLGDADRFRKWLADVEASRGRQLEYIQHNERYNDLDYSVWAGNKIRPVNALWALSTLVADIPDDMRVLPEHCVELAHALHARAADDDGSDELRAALARLSLPHSPIGLTVRDAAEWSRELLGVLRSLPADESAAVIQSLPSVQTTTTAMSTADGKLARCGDERAYLAAIMAQLVTRLKAADMLAALVFCWQRDTCTALAKACARADIKGLVNNPVTPAELRTLHYLSHYYNANDPTHQVLLGGIGVHHSGMPPWYRHAVEKLFREGRLAVVFCTTTLSLGINMPCRTVVFAGEATYLNALTYRQIAGRAGRRGFDDRGRVVFCGVPSMRIRRLICSRLPVLRVNRLLSPSLAMRLCVALYGVKVNAQESDRLVEGAKRLLDFARSQDDDDDDAARYARHVSFRFCLDTLRRAKLIDGAAAPNQWGTLVSHLFYMEPANFAFLALALHDGGRLLASLDDHELRVLLCTLFCDVPALDGIAPLPPLPASIVRFIEENARVVLQQAVHTWKMMLDAGVVTARDDEVMPHSGLCIATPPARASQATEAEGALVDAVDTLSLAKDDSECTQKERVKGRPRSKHGRGQKHKRRHKAAAAQTTKYHSAPQEDTSLRAFMEGRTLSYSLRSPFAALSGHDDQFDSLDEFDRSQRAGIHFDAHLVPIYELPKRRLNAYMLEFWENGDIAMASVANQVSRNRLHEDIRTFQLALKAVSAAFAVTIQRNNKAAFPSTMPTDAHQKTNAQLRRLVDEFNARYDQAMKDLFTPDADAALE